MLTRDERPPPADGRPAPVWVVEDEPAAAALAADLCSGSGAQAHVYHDGQLFLEALRSQPTPLVLVLDWRLERGLSAPLFMAARHRDPGMPIVFWTGTPPEALPLMIRQDARCRIVDKADGIEAFERALGWALTLAGASPRRSRTIPRPRSRGTTLVRCKGHDRDRSAHHDAGSDAPD